jgi:hypothetical protein
MFVANTDDADDSAIEPAVSLAENLVSRILASHEQRLAAMTEPFHDRLNLRRKVPQGTAYVETAMRAREETPRIGPGLVTPATFTN